MSEHSQQETARSVTPSRTCPYITSSGVELLILIRDTELLQKLTGGNWSRFCKQFEHVLSLAGKEDALIDENSTHSKQVKNLLYLFVDCYYSAVVDEAATAREAWDKLSKICAPLADIEAQRLFGEIFSFRMGSHETVADYFSRFKQLCSDYQAAGGSSEDLKGEMQRRIIIHGMQHRSEFETTLEIVMQSMQPDEITLEVLQQRLEQAEIYISEFRSADHHRDDRAHHHGTRAPRQHQQPSGRGRYQQNQKQPGSEVRCCNCGGRHHTAADCKRPKGFSHWPREQQQRYIQQQKRDRKD